MEVRTHVELDIGPVVETHCKNIVTLLNILYGCDFLAVLVKVKMALVVDARGRSVRFIDRQWRRHYQLDSNDVLWLEGSTLGLLNYGAIMEDVARSGLETVRQWATQGSHRFMLSIGDANPY